MVWRSTHRWHYQRHYQQQTIMIAPPHFDFHQMSQKGQSASRPSKMLYLFAVLLNFGGKFNLYFIQISGHQEYRNYSNLVLLSLPLTHVFSELNLPNCFLCIDFQYWIQHYNTVRNCYCLVFEAFSVQCENKSCIGISIFSWRNPTSTLITYPLTLYHYFLIKSSMKPTFKTFVSVYFSICKGDNTVWKFHFSV